MSADAEPEPGQHATPKHHEEEPGGAGAKGAPGRSEQQQEQAAQMIQRHYRGYRERRQLQGVGMDASVRWAEALRDAKWRNATRPMSRSERSNKKDSLPTPEQRERAGSLTARQTWKRVGEIARRAGGDDPEEDSQNSEEMSPEERAEYKRQKAKLKAEREKTAKTMDLQYFLEMVDQKHRYGSNLRAYHDHWKRLETTENFFYWLDYGAGKNFEHPTVSRERLEEERVRYLSREERLNYLVKIDKEGRLCWAKNGERISTTMEYKDSVNGIVPRDDDTPAFGPGGRVDSNQGKTRKGSLSTSSMSSLSSGSDHSDVEGGHYVNTELEQAKGISKIKYVSAATVLNHLLRGSVKPNSWIFVADTSFRLYVGIKQSGAFQHSSFLHGARISAAGLIKIKDGQLRRLSPLSGHYRPPTKNFRAFVHSLQDAGVNMSRVSISRSYAVLVGLEAYVKTRRKIKQGVGEVKEVETKIVHPERHEEILEQRKDKSESAEKERQLLAREGERMEREKRERNWMRRAWGRIRGGSLSAGAGVGGGADVEGKGSGNGGEKKDLEKKKEDKKKKWLSRKGEDVESGIAPSGERERGVA